METAIAEDTKLANKALIVQTYDNTLYRLKAFDILNHKILLKKLQSMGLKGKDHDIKICLLEDNKEPKFKTLKNGDVTEFGAPQDMILEPLLFQIY